MEATSEIIDTCNNHFADIFEKSGDDNQIFISFFGHFSKDTIDRLLEQLEDNLNGVDEIKRTKKRIFSIVVEGLQNILMHGQSTEDDYRLGFFTFSKNIHGFNIYFGNLLNISDHENTKKELKKINTYTHSELKQYHNKVLFGGKISSKGGAGLGLIITRLKSDFDLKGSFTKLTDSLMFYSLHTFVKSVSAS